MGIFSIFGKSSTDRGVQKFMETRGAVLVDVRTQEEYASGHIKGSVNIPLNAISDIEEVVPDRQTPVFVYCRSGARSGRAAELLRQLGYLHVENIGGIISYGGEVVR